MVLDDAVRNPTVEHDLCVVCPRRCFRAYLGEVWAFGDCGDADDFAVRHGVFVRSSPVGAGELYPKNYSIIQHADRHRYSYLRYMADVRFS